MKKLELMQTISILYRYQVIILNQRFQKYHIRTNLAPFILSILNSPGISQISLSKELCIDKATTTKAVTKLLENNFIEKISDSQDKRAFKLYISPKGEELCKNIKFEGSHFKKEILEGCSDEDYEITLKILDKILNNMKNIVAR
ncbi:MarR family winged helix-turn-helix transcriptional regulator [Fusobacterium sp. IOR10]|uniref:MarR family winged helix-turn-helix transcriptional regulator n=1 Tax=Fusobacterium sp. IOR10 TaxID=2665157 RepID=UPI0013D095B7|nr:MarR family transcriptional regulator [Fusobacterium sp. IOR10]